MALKFLDSFDHYLASDSTLKWTTTLSPVRRTGLHGYAMAGSLSKGMLFGSTTLIMEAFIQRLNAGSVFGLYDTALTNQISCAVRQDGVLKVERYGSNPAADFIAQTPPDVIRQNTWYHVGWTVTIHASAGAVEVRVNGETVITVSGIKTTATTLPWSGAVGGFWLGDNGNGVNFDDLVVMDSVDDGLNDPRLPGGGGFDKFLGPVEIIVKRPNGVGLLDEWTPTPTVPNWQNVDDLTPDADATYNGALPDAVGASDLFHMQDLAPHEDVVGVQSLVLARKTEEGVAAIAKLVHDNAATTVGTTVYQPSTYSYLHAPEPTLPGGTLWSAARWDAIQYGYRRVV
jgi:hypothetical protein